MKRNWIVFGVAIAAVLWLSTRKAAADELLEDEFKIPCNLKKTLIRYRR